MKNIPTHVLEEIAEYYAGSCEFVTSGKLEEFGLTPAAAIELELNFHIIQEKFELFCCEDCGWWGDLGEFGECSECGGDLI